MSDEFFCDVPELRNFIARVKEIAAQDVPVDERLAAIRPHFSQMMVDPNWLPEEFRHTSERGKMGQGIANWLLYRAGDSSLSLSALVLPPGVTTPVHDHLTWGLVGVYVGEQEEEVYEPTRPVETDDRHAELMLVARNHLIAGSFYALIPPGGDIHRVIAAGDIDSISLHLLANDIGCTWRHTFHPESGEVVPFQSAYTNMDCASG